MTPVSARNRLLVAAGFALVAGLIAWRAQYIARAGGGDFLMLWRATRIVLSGGDPYLLKWWTDLRAAQTPFYYPLPAIGIGLPFVWLRAQDAAVAFVALSAGLLGFILSKYDLDRLAIVFSVPFVFAAQLSQTTFLIVALGLLPALAGLTVMKPNIGLALFAYRPAWRTAVLGAALLLGSVVFWPWWPREWVGLVRDSPVHHSPLSTGVGAVAVLALLRWRRPEARLLFAMSVIPHALYFYDELPLWLVAASRRQAMMLTASSWLGWVGWVATSGAPGGPLLIDTPVWVVVALYLPSLLMVLARENVGDVPDWLERLIAPLPAWLRGTSLRPELAAASNR
jgi:hypothetical protein